MECNVALVRLMGRGFRTSLNSSLIVSSLIPLIFDALVLASMNATDISVADLSRLNFLLAELYAEAVLETQKRAHLKSELIGCHGQTLYHQGEPENFLGRKLAVTWQIGEGSVLAARVGVPVVCGFPSR